MEEFFKKIGRGIGYIFVPVIWIVGMAITTVVSLFLMVFLFIKSTILFFTGRSLNDDLPEDKKAKEIIFAIENPAPQNPTPTVQPSPVEVQPIHKTINITNNIIASPDQQIKLPNVDTLIAQSEVAGEIENNYSGKPQIEHVEVKEIPIIQTPVEEPKSEQIEESYDEIEIDAGVEEIEIDDDLLEVEQEEIEEYKPRTNDINQKSFFSKDKEDE